MANKPESPVKDENYNLVWAVQGKDMLAEQAG